MPTMQVLLSYYEHFDLWIDEKTGFVQQVCGIY